jgi:hypothetical protein
LNIVASRSTRGHPVAEEGSNTNKKPRIAQTLELRRCLSECPCRLRPACLDSLLRDPPALRTTELPLLLALPA